MGETEPVSDKPTLNPEEEHAEMAATLGLPHVGERKAKTRERPLELARRMPQRV